MIDEELSEVERLRRQVASYEEAAVSSMIFAIFADGRQPTANERHLWNLLSWRNAEAACAGAELARLRQIISNLADRVVAQNELLIKKAEKS